jgi:nicotine blue oxidoreductase
MIAVVVLAAGGSSRFGSPKQLHLLGGRPMLERVLAAAEAAPVGGERIVVLGANAGEVLRRVDLHGARPVIAPGWEAGQGASLAAGLAAVSPDADAALVVLGDGPWISPAAIARLAARAGERPGVPLRAAYDGCPAHPVVLPRAVWPSLPPAGDGPGRGLEFVPVDCSDLPEPGDVDYSA